MFRRLATLSRSPQSVSRRYLSVRAHTLFSPTPELLDKHLSSNTHSPTSVSVYLLSTSLPASALQPLISALQSRLPASIGSFLSSPPGTEASLAIATFERGATFRTALSGRPAAQVGKYQRPGPVLGEDRKGDKVGEIEEVKGEEGWDGLWRSGGEVPRIEEIEAGFGDIKPRSILMLTDGQPSSVALALDAMYPQSSHIGLVTAPTPFLTGRPNTLIHNKEIFSSGAVGLVLEQSLETHTDFGLRPLAEEFTIKGAQGNMLLSFEEGSGNPTQTLMAAIHRRDAGGLSNKDEEFFLRVRGGMIKILSGDPSRGAMSLDMEEPLTSGEKVQFMYRDERPLTATKPNNLVFSALRRTDDEEQVAPVGTPRIVEGFLGTSEEGFLHGNGVVCAVPNASASWSVGTTK